MNKIISLTILYVLSLHVPVAAAWDVLVVQSFRAKPYTEALRGFRTSCNASVHELVISELNGEDVTAEVRRRKPDLILAIGMDALLKVRKIKGKPVVYLMVLNPNLALHGKDNITGISMAIPPEKQIAEFLRILPRLKRIGLIYNPKNTGPLVARASKAAERFGIELKAMKANKFADFPELLDNMKGNIDAYWMLPDGMIITPQSIEYLIFFSMQNRIPVFTFSEKYLQMGAFLSMEVNTFSMGKQAGDTARKILSGVPVGELPKLEAADAIITVNYKVAHNLGISVFGEAVSSTRASR